MGELQLAQRYVPLEFLRLNEDVHAGSVRPSLSTASENGFHVLPISLVFLDAVESLVGSSALLFSVACRVWIETVAGCPIFLLVDELLDGKQKAVGSHFPRRKVFAAAAAVDEPLLVRIIFAVYNWKRMDAVDAAFFVVILQVVYL